MNDIAARKDLLACFLDDVWSAGDIEACDQYVADEYVIHHDPGDPWDGQRLSLEGFKERVRLLRAPFPDQRFVVRALVGEDRMVAATWLWSAAHTGDIPGFPATGDQVRMSGVTLYHFDENNRICGHWQISDRLSVFQQLQRNKLQ